MADRASPSAPSKPTGAVGRGIALAIALAALGLMVWIGRNDVASIQYAMSLISGKPTSETQGSGNPELDACLAQRVGDVDQMKADGVINASQYEAFKSRAISLCQAQHPPAN